ncbi:MAG: nucleoside deaminase [Clostridia bacterium]|nr:nucleoside deaminase [Clostridia bacterium]
MNRFMQLAIDEARYGIKNGHGGPFGSVIVKDGEVVAQGHNHVVANNDPTCHGEVDAIRNACQKLNTFDLSGCEIYTTGEPCPMCLCACMWANIKKVYYGATIADNEMIGFRDNKFDDLMGGREKLADYLEMVDRENVLELFNEYNNMDKTMY